MVLFCIRLAESWESKAAGRTVVSLPAEPGVCLKPNQLAGTLAETVLRTEVYFFTANTPSPTNSVTNPAWRRRFATSFGTSRPLVSLLGVPV